MLKDKDAQFLPHFANFGQSARDGAHSAIFDWNPATKKFSVFSGGNRNAYDYAYNLAGEAFLFDSDMEWDIGLPWYREVRTVHQVLNGNYGYRNGSGKYPPYYIDSLPPVRDLGRGSPVGVEFYTSYAYPREFFDNAVRGGLVARAAALHRADAGGRDVHGREAIARSSSTASRSTSPTSKSARTA